MLLSVNPVFISINTAVLSERVKPISVYTVC